MTYEYEEDVTEPDPVEDQVTGLKKALRAEREKVKEANARIEALSVPARERLLEKAGFHRLDSPEARVLVREMEAGTIEMDEQAIRGYAEDYGMRVQLNAFEQQAMEQAQRHADLMSVTTSDTPPDEAQEIAEADARGDDRGARALRVAALAKEMRDR